MSDYLELLINGDEYTDDYFDDVLNELIGIKTKADFEHNYQEFLKEQK